MALTQTNIYEEVSKDLLEFGELNEKIESFSSLLSEDSFSDPMDMEEYKKLLSDKEWLLEKIAEKVVNNSEYSTQFNNIANEEVKSLVNEQDLENLKKGRFYDPDSWMDDVKDKVNKDLEDLDTGRSTYEELQIDEKRLDPQYAKLMDEYISIYNSKVSSSEKVSLDDYKHIAD